MNFANQQGTVNPDRYAGTTSLDAGGMVYALGQDIDTTLYLDMNNQQGKIAQYVQYLMGAGLSQSVAMSKAPQMALAYYVQSYLDSLESDVKYLEVAASVPVVGYIGAVLEVSLKEVNV